MKLIFIVFHFRVRLASPRNQYTSREGNSSTKLTRPYSLTKTPISKQRRKWKTCSTVRPRSLREEVRATAAEAIQTALLLRWAPPVTARSIRRPTSRRCAASRESSELLPTTKLNRLLLQRKILTTTLSTK